MVAAATAIALSTPALAATDAPAFSAANTAAVPSDWVWNDDGGTGPLRVVVSLADQRAYVYRGANLIAVSTASSGRDGKETPTGTFPILQKQVDHESTLYDSAPMPYMERLTWDGVALHAGVTPGYPTSHGCVHLPLAFAKKLYSQTKLGTVVDVTDASIMDDAASPVVPTPAVAIAINAADARATAAANAAVLADND